MIMVCQTILMLVAKRKCLLHPCLGTIRFLPNKAKINVMWNNIVKGPIWFNYNNELKLTYTKFFFSIKAND